MNNSIYLGNLIGATGPLGGSGGSGATGPSGPMGATGPSQGATGPTGPGGNAGATGPSGPSAIFNGTSTTSINLSDTTNVTVGATATLAVESGKSWSTGQSVIVNSSSASYSGQYFILKITSYSGTSLVGTISSISGTATIASWTVNLSGPEGGVGGSGPTGPTGPIGNQGATGPRGVTSFSGGGNTTISMTGDLALSCMATDIFHVKMDASGRISFTNFTEGQKVHVLVEMTTTGAGAGANLTWDSVLFNNNNFNQIGTASHGTLYEVIKIGSKLLGKHEYDYDLS